MIEQATLNDIVKRIVNVADPGEDYPIWFCRAW